MMQPCALEAAALCVHRCGWSLYHLLPSTDHLPPATCHLPPTTDHRPPTTYHRPPTTYHLVQVRLEPDALQCDAWMRERLPAQLYAALFAHQREGVVFALQRGGRALIADEMGLGKSFQALSLTLTLTTHHSPLTTHHSTLM